MVKPPKSEILLHALDVVRRHQPIKPIVFGRVMWPGDPVGATLYAMARDMLEKMSERGWLEHTYRWQTFLGYRVVAGLQWLSPADRERRWHRWEQAALARIRTAREQEQAFSRLVGAGLE
jgi:hypothetical protein